MMHSLRNSEVETLKKHSKDSTSNVGVESPYGKILYRGHPRNSFCYVPCRFVPRMSLKMIVGETPRCRSLVQRGCGFHRSFSSNFNGRNRNKAANMNADSVEAVVKFSKSGTSRVQCTIPTKSLGHQLQPEWKNLPFWESGRKTACGQKSLFRRKT